jgi:hypothetical protein
MELVRFRTVTLLWTTYIAVGHFRQYLRDYVIGPGCMVLFLQTSIPLTGCSHKFPDVPRIFVNVYILTL